MGHVLEWVCVVPVLLSHVDVLVCDGYKKQEAGPSFSKYGRIKLCISASNVLTSRSTE